MSTEQNKVVVRRFMMEALTGRNLGLASVTRHTDARVAPVRQDQPHEITAKGQRPVDLYRRAAW